MTGPRAINAAEAVICPFWDPAFDEIGKWTVVSGEAHGLSVHQFWCWTTFDWTRTPKGGPALQMHRELDIDCSRYDALIVSAMTPPGSVLEVQVTTDAKTGTYTSEPAGKLKHEHPIPLGGATRIQGLVLRVYDGNSGVRSGWFNWIGLQSTDAVCMYERQWQCYDSTWEEYIKPVDYEPSFEPALGIVATNDELSRIRASHAEFVGNHDSSPFLEMAEAVRGAEPEASIGEFVSFYSSTRMTTDTRYNRERDHEKMLVTSGQKAAISGIILGDRELLRLSARYAMSLAMCTNWEDGMVNKFPGSTFDTRCFVQALCLHDIAMILDLAGEMFTDLGLEFLRRRLSEEGLAVVNYNTWKYEYLYHCNQLAWFSPGRMLAYLVVEKTWPRAKPYTDICYNDLVENMELSILSDGGFVEGPNYFQCVGRDASLAFYYYAKARDLDFRQIVPEIVRQTGTFGAAIASTDESKDVVPICDAKSGFDQQALSFLAYLMPESSWGSMLEKSLKRSGMATSIVGNVLDQERSYSHTALDPLVVLPEMGVACSHRQVEGKTVKFLVMGNHAGASHTHEDKGSFVLEFAGETFAMDPGTCDYSDPFSNILKGCERHNMLVPTGVNERPCPENPIAADIKPRAEGNARHFTASIDLSPGWAKYYRTWTRRFDSPAPDTFIIEDTYHLSRGTGVAFYWNTKLCVDTRVDSEGTAVIISGSKGIVTLRADDARNDARNEHDNVPVIVVEELPLPDNEIQRRIGFSQPGQSGTLRISAQLTLR